MNYGGEDDGCCCCSSKKTERWSYYWVYLTSSFVLGLFVLYFRVILFYLHGNLDDGKSSSRSQIYKKKKRQKRARNRTCSPNMLSSVFLTL